MKKLSLPPNATFGLQQFKQNSIWHLLVTKFDNSFHVLRIAKLSAPNEYSNSKTPFHLVPKHALFACGFTQIPGEDYNDTYTPVVKASSIRWHFTLAAQEDLLAFHFDVETAFLNGDLEENILVEILLASLSRQTSLFLKDSPLTTSSSNSTKRSTVSNKPPMSGLPLSKTKCYASVSPNPLPTTAFSFLVHQNHVSFSPFTLTIFSYSSNTLHKSIYIEGM
jgi:hypothetical protein